MLDGKTPPRGLSSFGVSGLLAEGCKVYYDNLFSSRHLGRVSDLICARLRDIGLDELRIRAIVLFAFFEAYRTHANASASPALLEPLVLECGIDPDTVAIGMVFRSGFGLDTDALGARILAGKPNGAFEELLSELYRQSDQLVVRVQVGVQMELVMLLSTSGQAKSAKTAPQIVLMMAEADVGETPAAGEYVQLGDTEYVDMLASDVPGREARGPVAGDFLAQGCSELEEALRLRARATAIEQKFKVAGAPEESDTERILIKGTGSDLVDGTTTTITGDEAEEPVASRAFGGLFKKVWPFKKKDEEEEGASELEEALRPVKPLPPIEESAPIPAIEIETGGLDRTLNKAQDDFNKEFKNDVSNVKAKRWMDGLMGDLMQEKARLAEASKKLNSTIRQKEHEFRTKEIQLHEELRRRDDLLRQKTSALNRAKDQLGMVNMTMEKLKTSKHEKSEDSHFKQKFTVTQRLLSSTKDENIKLHQKVEEMKLQMTTVQAQANLKSKTNSNTIHNEYAALKMKHERQIRQAEELRKMNDQLTARIQLLAERVDSKPVTPSSVVEKRLEAAMKQVATSQKDSEQLKLRVEELQREEMRLKMELKRNEVELRTFKAGTQRGGKPPKAA